MTPTEIFIANEKVITDYLQMWGLTDYLKQIQEAVDSNSNKDAAYAAHYAWEALPDRMDIREGGFFRLCDMAECIFDF